MATEIERKFLVVTEAWRARVTRSRTMRQGYLSGSEKGSVRVRISGGEAWLNIKSATLGVRRLEFEYAIPLTDATDMLERLCDGPLIEKIRHDVPVDGHLWEVDEFLGENAGLVVAEIELGAENEAFTVPEWIGDEVSHDPRYYNVSLVKRPYRLW